MSLTKTVKFFQIACGADGKVLFGLDSEGRVWYKYVLQMGKSDWERIPSPEMTCDDEDDHNF